MEWYVVIIWIYMKRIKVKQQQQLIYVFFLVFYDESLRAFPVPILQRANDASTAVHRCSLWK